MAFSGYHYRYSVKIREFFMSKYIACLAAFFLCLALCGADLTLADGSVYLNAEIKSCSAGFVLLIHDKGEAKIALEQLPENFIVALSSRQRNSLRNNSDIKFADGRIYKNCTVKSMGLNKVTVKHSQGTVDIPFNELPKYYRATFDNKMLARIRADKTSASSAAKTAEIIGKTAKGDIVYAGPRGGRYYINESNRKVYLRKDIEIKPVEGVNTTVGQP